MGTKSIMDQVYDSIKCWVELADVYYVGKDHLIYRKDSNELEMMEVSNKQFKPLRVFGDNMASGDFLVFNPYIETIGVADEREWFYNLINMIIGTVVQRTVEEIINTAISKEEVDKYEKLSLISPLIKDIDQKTLKEFNSLGAFNNFLEIAYNKKAKVSRVRCALLEEDFMATIPKMRKKSWRVFHSLMHTLLKSDDLDSDFSHTATIIGMPRIESFLTVAAKIFKAINDNSKLFLDKTFPIRKLNTHVSKLAEYDRAKSGLVFTNAKGSMTNKAKVPTWKSSVDSKPKLVPVGAFPMSNLLNAKDEPIQDEYIVTPEEADQLRQNNNKFNPIGNTMNSMNNCNIPMSNNMSCNIPMVNTRRFKTLGGF